MCNDYEQHVSYRQYIQALHEQGLRAAQHQGDADLPPADDIRIGDIGPVMRMEEDGVVALSPMRFGFPPAQTRGGKSRGGPVFNFRSENRSFAESRRCLIPASAFFEFTGQKYPKAKHRFTLLDFPFMAIAGLWRPADRLSGEGGGTGDSNQPPSFAMLTTVPGPDVAAIHHRQIVVLRPQDWGRWLNPTRPESELLKPLPEGSLMVEQIRPGSG